MQTPQVQTYIAKKAINKLEEGINGRMEIGKIHTNPFKAVVIKDLVILDSAPYRSLDGRLSSDTLFRAGSIEASFSIKNMFSPNGLYIRSARIADAMMYLSIEPGSDSLSSTNNLKRIFRLGRNSGNKEKSDKDIFTISDVNIDNMSFVMYNWKKDPAKFAGGINWFDMEVRDICLEGKNLKMKGPVMSGECRKLSFSEKSGYVCLGISGTAKVGNGLMSVSGFRLKDPWSDIDIPDLQMSYKDTDSWTEFVTDVRMRGDIRPSEVSLKSLRYYAPALAGRSMIASVHGLVDGPVCNMRLERVNIVTRHEEADSTLSGISAIVNGSISGLPETSKMTITADISNAEFTSDAIGNFVRGWAPSAKLNISKFCPGQTLEFNGRVSGRLNDFSVSGDISSDTGYILTSLDIRNAVNRDEAIGISGDIMTDGLDVHSLLGKGPVGECNVDATLSANISKENISLDIKSLNSDKLNIAGYDYSGISAAGKFTENMFDGRIVCSDPNLNLLFQGLISFSNKTGNAIYNFYANIGYADLNALNFDKRGTSRLSLTTRANFTRIGGDNIIGKIDINNLRLEGNSGAHEIGDIIINSHTRGDINRIQFNSKFAEASYSGSSFLSGFVKDISNLTLASALPSALKNRPKKYEGNHYDISLQFHDSKDILSFLSPGAYIADNTDIRLKVSEDGALKAGIVSDRIAYKGKYIKGVHADICNPAGGLVCNVTGDEISVSPLEMKAARACLTAAGDSLRIDYIYDNREDNLQEAGHGNISLKGKLSRNRQGILSTTATFLPSDFILDSRKWMVKSEMITVRDGDIGIRGLKISNGNQSVLLDGGISKTATDTLSLILNKFDMDIINLVTADKMGIRGKATGKAMLVSPVGKEAGLLANLTCDSTMIAGRELGLLRIASVREEENDRFSIYCRNELNGGENIRLSGFYYPSGNRIEGKLNLNSFDIGYATPLTSSIFPDMGGSISGNISFKGPAYSLDVESSNLRLDDAKLKVGYTGVEYTANGPVSLSSNGVRFENVQVRDDSEGEGMVSGSIDWDRFRNISFNTQIDFSKMQVIDIAEGENPIFYGDLSATGTFGISGPFNSIMLTATASTANNGFLSIPISNANSSSTSNLLTFREKEQFKAKDPYDEIAGRYRKKEKKSSDLGIKLSITATPEVRANIEIDKASGNVITGNGNGRIDLEIRPSKSIFNINGNYNITNGIYHFVALGVAKRDFSIQDGSSIRFNGDIMESDLDINARYRTKASVGTLIADTTSVSTRRIVDCGISISDKLRNPRLGFTIDIPDLDPTTKAKVESALNTQDKVQKQLLALLLTSSFIPDEASSITNRSSSILYSNMTEIMAGQLNNILQKLDIPIDFGLDYQQNMSGTDIFDVALSTALFNNRVTVNGNIGNRQYGIGGGGSEVVGDLDIDVKLDKSGTFRLNLFSHSADQYTSYLDNSQRNGLGLTFQKEYYSIGEFFRNLFKRKRRRLEEDAAAQKDTTASHKKLIIRSNP